MKIKFIVNPTSGRRSGARLGQKLIDFGEVSCTDLAGQNCARELAKEAVFRGFDRVVAVGGDGIVNEIINGLAEAGGLDTPFGIIPAGVGNSFAKNLGIPQDFPKALEVALGSAMVRVDLGKINGRYFSNVVSFGFDAKVTDLARSIKEKYGFLPKDLTYLLAALRENALVGPGKYRVAVNVNGHRLTGSVSLLVIANGQSYGGIFRIAPEADLQDGLFDLCWVKPISKVEVLTRIHRVVQGTHATLPEVETLKSEAFTVSSPDPLIGEMDGEILEPQKEYRICSVPRALRVLVPPPPHAEKIKEEVPGLQPA